MSTDLEDRIRQALTSRADAINPATLRETRRAAFDDESRINPTERCTQQLVPAAEPGRPNRGQHAAAWLSVAAVVALILTSVGLATRTDPGRSPLSVAGSSSNSLSLLRALHFAIDLPAGFRITDVLTSTDGTQTVQINMAGNRNVIMEVDPPTGANRHFASDARPITVAGRPGFIGSTWTDQTATSKTLSTSIAWKYNDAAYAVFLDPQVPRATLLALARRIDFSKHTPVRVATSIRKLPLGTHLSVINSTYRDSTPHAAYSWDSTVMLSLDSSPRDAIRIELCRCASSTSARSTARTRKINGKRAYIYPNGQGGSDVEIDEGNGVTLHVSSSHNDGGRWTGTMDTLLELARSISITRHPTRPATWLNAATALPR